MNSWLCWSQRQNSYWLEDRPGFQPRRPWVAEKLWVNSRWLLQIKQTYCTFFFLLRPISYHGPFCSTNDFQRLHSCKATAESAPKNFNFFLPFSVQTWPHRQISLLLVLCAMSKTHVSCLNDLFFWLKKVMVKEKTYGNLHKRGRCAWLCNTHVGLTSSIPNSRRKAVFRKLNHDSSLTFVNLHISLITNYSSFINGPIFSWSVYKSSYYSQILLLALPHYSFCCPDFCLASPK